MCGNHRASGGAEAIEQWLVAPPRPVRRKLWEIEDRWHCAVIGTCLTLGELRKVAAKARLKMPPDASDYVLHGIFVNMVSQPGLVGKFLQKGLDRKFAAHVARFSRAASAEELRALWDQALAAGDVAGGYWALMTHPAATMALCEHVYGEIHMLSHLSGASNRDEIKRRIELERRVAALEAELVQQKERARRDIAERDAKIRDLEWQAIAAAAALRRAEEQEARIADLETGCELRLLRCEVYDLRVGLDKARARADIAERRLGERDGRIAELTESSMQLARMVDELRADCALLERQAGLDEANAGEAADADVPDLSGRCILYVGGRNRMVPHLQSLVSRCNGELLHHDGGVEESANQLAGALSRADAILCPMDCVSHEAVHKIKKACQKCSKPFIPLRSAGLSSFVRGLRALEN